MIMMNRYNIFWHQVNSSPIDVYDEKLYEQYLKIDAQTYMNICQTNTKSKQTRKKNVASLAGASEYTAVAFIATLLNRHRWLHKT